MTISSSTRKAGPFPGNGVTVAYPFTFKVFTQADVLAVRAVTATGLETTLALGSDYTISLNGDQNTSPGGTLTMLVAAPTGSTVTLTSQVANTQGVDLTNLGGFYPAVINNALDRATIQIQQLAEKVSRALTFGISSGASGSLPNPSALALLGWNAAGTALQNFAGGASAAVSTFMASVVAAVDAAAAQTALGATTVGRALFGATDAAAACTAIGAATAGPLAASGITGAAASGANNDITSLTGLTSPIRQVREIQPISASVSGNALTISASALSLEFRSATLGSGTVSFVQGTPANLVISSGSTLGTINATQSRIVVLALNNAGTIELAAVNIAGGNDLSETGLISTTAEGGAGAADSASVIYSTTARASVPYRVIGYIESTQATAGTWATAPSTIQGVGGQALAAMSSLGYGQSWQTVTRVMGTTYYNTTGRPIQISVRCDNIASMVVGIYVNGLLLQDNGVSALNYLWFNAIIPPGASYSATLLGGSGTIGYARELR